MGWDTLTALIPCCFVFCALRVLLWMRARLGRETATEHGLDTFPFFGLFSEWFCVFDGERVV